MQDLVVVMHKLGVALLCLATQTGCWAIGVVVIGNEGIASLPSGSPMNSYHTEWKTRSEVMFERGVPSAETSTPAGCNVLEYEGRLIWAGIVPVVVIIPIPLVIPVGRADDRIYLDGDTVVGRTFGHTDAVQAFAYACDDYGCGPQWGPVRGDPGKSYSLAEIARRCD